MRSLIAACIALIIASSSFFVPEAEATLTATQAASSSMFSTLQPCRNLLALIYARRRNRQGFVPPCDPRFLLKRQPIRSSSSSSSSAAASSPGSSSSSGAASSSGMDRDDTTIRSQFLLLGETGPVIGAAKAFLYEEPLDVTAVSVTLTTDVASTISAMLIYDDAGHLIGRATLTAVGSSVRTYRLPLPHGSFIIDKATERGVYVRPEVRSRDGGGLGNLTVKIDTISFEGSGVWSNQSYVRPSSGTNQFPTFVTARSVLTSVTNAGDLNGSLVTGTSRTLGAFRFEGRSRDASPRLAIRDLTFTIEQTGGVQLSNVRLMIPGFSEMWSCAAGVSAVTCSALSDTFGSMSDGPRELQLVGDISADDPLNASLRLTLNEPGSAVSSGSVTWTDGTSTFTWVPVAAPVAAGTMWKY
ncbi:MAG: hypothetical protein PHZ00_01135 [Candidatus Peribacteraceae bacterium]|nr:hypothetical protein [Candidatus Peribacteraceae bacterium]